MILLLLTYVICWNYQDAHGISIDKLLLRGIKNPNVMEMQDEASGVVSRDLDMLFTLRQWGEIMERNKTGFPGGRYKRKGSAVNHLWPGAVIPYEISQYYTADNSRVVRDALSNWEKDTCVRFRPSTPSDINKVIFTVGSANVGQCAVISDAQSPAVMTGSEGLRCKSFLGMDPDGSQYLYLNEDCRTMEGVITHEVGHVLGLYHEQSRPDRDQFVTINWDKIPEMVRPNFDSFSGDVINTYGVSYDYKSIMHYGATAFSPSDDYTIIPKDPNFLRVIGNREHLSFRDIKIINIMYKCGGQCALKTCPGEGFVNKNCVCMCPGNPLQPCSQGGTEPNAGGRLPEGFDPNANQGEKPCVDDNTQCGVWAAGDQCQQNPSFMGRFCQKSCGICGDKKPECTDANSQCGPWARVGECDRNPTYMTSFCKLSCGQCPGASNPRPTASPCKDLNSNCQSWSMFGYCTNPRNEAYMRSNCHKSCNLCNGGNVFHDDLTTSCTDDDQSCSGWADVGEYENNPSWMLSNCRKSCKQC